MPDELALCARCKRPIEPEAQSLTVCLMTLNNGYVDEEYYRFCAGCTLGLRTFMEGGGIVAAREQPPERVDAPVVVVSHSRFKPEEPL